MKQKVDMKKIIKTTFIVVFAAIAGYGVYMNQKTDTMPDLVLDDVEAIAACEVSASGNNKGGCSKDVSTSKEYCVTGGWGPACCATI